MSDTEILFINIIYENYKDVEKVRSYKNNLTRSYEITIYFKNKFRKEIEITSSEIREKVIENTKCYENYIKDLENFIKQKIDEVDYIRN